MKTAASFPGMEPTTAALVAMARQRAQARVNERVFGCPDPARRCDSTPIRQDNDPCRPLSLDEIKAALLRS